MANVSGSIHLVKRKRGDRFYARYRLAAGEQRTQSLGRVWRGQGRPPMGYLTKKMARAKLDEILTEARMAAPPEPGSGASFADAAAEYLRFVEEERQVGATTVADYSGVIHGYLIGEFGSLPIEEVTPDLIDAYKRKLLVAGKLSNRSIVRHLTVLHGIFKRAKRVWGLSENPASADLVERPKVVYTGEFDTYGRDELELLATAAESPQDSALYLTAAFTGLRTGELFGLRWNDVDFLDGLVHVRRSWDHKNRAEKVPKGKRVRSVPLMPDAMDALAKLKEREHFATDGDLVFCSEVGEHLDYYNHLRRYKASLKRAGLRELRFHDLRHAFGSSAITVLDPYSVQTYMGHQNYSTTQRYLHHKPRREDAAKLQEAFAGKSDQPPEPAEKLPQNAPRESL